MTQDDYMKDSFHKKFTKILPAKTRRRAGKSVNARRREVAHKTFGKQKPKGARAALPTQLTVFEWPVCVIYILYYMLLSNAVWWSCISARPKYYSPVKY